jgi:hypothetical protein
MTETISSKKSKSYFTYIMPLIGLFVAIACIVALVENKLNALNINSKVLLTSNVLLFLLSSINIKLFLNASTNKNPNASVQSVLLSTILKLFVLGGAVFAYLIFTKQQSIYAIFGAMFFYILYTVIEKSIAMKIKK